jgi:hypothetical protein
MNTRRSVFGALVGAILLLVLAGCVRFQADLSVSPENTVNGSVVVAVIVGDEADSRDVAAESADKIEAQLLSNLRGAPGVRREVYDQDGYLGSRFTFAGTPLSAFEGSGSDGSLSLTRDGDEFVFSGILDFTPGDDEAEVDPDDDTSNITVAVHFPGAVTEHNGELAGNTVTWTTSLEAKIDMEARASAISSGPPAWVWILVGVSVVLLAFVTVLVVRRRGQRPPIES